MSTVDVWPQPGPQSSFLASSADIVIYGGAAGGGKTWALLLEGVRHIDVSGFAAVFFRRTTVQIRNPGGLWDESLKLYGAIGAKPRADVLEWRFRSGAKVKFAHLEHDTTVLEWQGAQIPLICFDELTHFSESQFWYLLSRNRSMCGVRPYVRATCNPDADSWVAKLIAWWINPVTGLPIPSRAGKVRWFIRRNGELVWADSAEELKASYSDAEPKSLTFVPAKLEDNAALLAADPSYRANLLALPEVERDRLLNGNWKVRKSGNIFKRDWFQLWPSKTPLPRFEFIVQSWDTAYTEKVEENDPTAFGAFGVFLSPITGQPNVLLLDCWSEHLAVPDLLPRVLQEYKTEYGLPSEFRDTGAPIIRPPWWRDDSKRRGRGVDCVLIEDKGSGIGLRQALERQGVPVRAYNPGKLDKVARAHIVTPLLSDGRLWVPESQRSPGQPRDWCEPLIDQLVAFPNGGHDDYVDVVTQVLRLLTDLRFLILEDDDDHGRPDPDDYPEPAENPYAA